MFSLLEVVDDILLSTVITTMVLNEFKINGGEPEIFVYKRLHLFLYIYQLQKFYFLVSCIMKLFLLLNYMG